MHGGRYGGGRYGAAVDTMAAISQKVDTMAAKREFVYKIPCRARAWPSGCIGRVRRASKGILHTKRVTHISEIF